MEQIMSSLTVFFDSPFWVGVYQRCTGSRIEAARVVFGAEPKDAEVYAYFLEHWGSLRFSPAVEQNKQLKRRPIPSGCSEKCTDSSPNQVLVPRHSRRFS